MRSVLVIQNAQLEGLGHFGPALDDLGVEARILQAWAGEKIPATLGPHDALIVLGGPPSAYEPSSGPWMGDAMSLLRATHGRAPILGVCLGAQLAAHALGGRARPGHAAEVGYHGLHLTDAGRTDPLVAELRGRVFQLHHDTYDLPHAAVRLASSSRFPEQAFRLGRATYGVQFHVEFRAEDLARILPHERKDLESEGVDVDFLLAEARRRDPDMAEAARGLIAAFTGLGLG
jgi:GMP synthase (glutamine-hydrolysing)